MDCSGGQASNITRNSVAGLRAWQVCPKCGGKKSHHAILCWSCRGPSGLRHGHNTRSGKSPTYTSWDSMIQRCTNPKDKHYYHYGKRGISVCERWMTFSDFLKDMGERPKGKTIDRFPEQNGNYEPSNCRWATKREQQNNMSRNRLVTHAGETLSIAEWSRRLGVKYSTLHQRLQLGMWP